LCLKQFLHLSTLLVAYPHAAFIVSCVRSPVLFEAGTELPFRTSGCYDSLRPTSVLLKVLARTPSLYVRELKIAIIDRTLRMPLVTSPSSSGFACQYHSTRGFAYSYVIRRMNKRPVSGCSSDTQSHTIDTNYKRDFRFSRRRV
jgi:hypothetical protein